MVFASLIFLCVFLPLNLILYYISNNENYRNYVLILFSLIFYAWGEPVWVILLIFSATVDYFNALLVEKFRHTKWKRLGLISSVVINLGLLIAFKYSGFIYENINAIFGLELKVPSFTLPIGISFYTFQTISYVVDVYSGKVEAQKSYFKFLMFVSLFHQLVAGPIVRYSHINYEINHRKFNIIDLSAGIKRFCVGLFKKVAIANVAGAIVQVYFKDGSLSHISVGEAWFAIIAFSLQIYFDFSGYSDMAIGLGRMFGFHYHENFNYPYVARSASDFWRRWHISLGSFFRDYVYIPLGGNRKNRLLSLFAVWFLTGLWHGASWNYIIWGLYFGVLIWLERAFLQKFLDSIPRIFSHIYLLFAVVLGWALFYFEDFGELKHFFAIIFGLTDNAWWSPQLTSELQQNIYWLVVTILLCMPIYLHLNNWFIKRMKYKNEMLPWVITMLAHYILLFVSIAMLVGNSYNPFIYGRF